MGLDLSLKLQVRDVYSNEMMEDCHLTEKYGHWNDISVANMPIRGYRASGYEAMELAGASKIETEYGLCWDNSGEVIVDDPDTMVTVLITLVNGLWYGSSGVLSTFDHIHCLEDMEFRLILQWC